MSKATAAAPPSTESAVPAGHQRTRQSRNAPDCRAATINIATQRQSKSGDHKNPCEARSSTRSSLRYRPPLHTPTAATVLIQIVAQHTRSDLTRIVDPVSVVQNEPAP